MDALGSTLPPVTRPVLQRTESKRSLVSVLRGLRLSGTSEPTSPRSDRRFSPRAIRKSGRSSDDSEQIQEHITKLRNVLNGTEQADRNLQEGIFLEWENRINRDVVDSDMFACAAADLWRVCDKITVVDAKNKTDGEDNPSRNGQFAALLQAFGIVDALDTSGWESIEHVSKWATLLHKKGQIPERLMRFMRSCSQGRYTGNVAYAFILGNYGHVSESGYPIEVHFASEGVRITRVFDGDGSNKEAIVVPIQIFKRGTKDLIGRFDWCLSYFYDSECRFLRATSTATQVVALKHG